MIQRTYPELPTQGTGGDVLAQSEEVIDNVAGQCLQERIGKRGDEAVPIQSLFLLRLRPQHPLDSTDALSCQPVLLASLFCLSALVGLDNELPDLVEKCRLYAAYYASLARKQVDSRSLPDVLAVTTSPLRENVIRRALASALEEVSRPPALFLTSVAPLFHRLGPLGVVWQDADGSARRRWP